MWKPLSLQSMTALMEEAVFPDSEESCLLKNFGGTIEPVVLSFGAYAFGGVSKTLHLTQEVFRERIRSLGDDEFVSPENKYIENNYEPILAMQIVENSASGGLRLGTKWVEEVKKDDGPPVLTVEKEFIPPRARKEEKAGQIQTQVIKIPESKLIDLQPGPVALTSSEPLQETPEVPKAGLETPEILESVPPQSPGSDESESESSEEESESESSDSEEEEPEVQIPLGRELSKQLEQLEKEDSTMPMPRRDYESGEFAKPTLESPETPTKSVMETLEVSKPTTQCAEVGKQTTEPLGVPATPLREAAVIVNPDLEPPAMLKPTSKPSLESDSSEIAALDTQSVETSVLEPPAITKSIPEEPLILQSTLEPPENTKSTLEPPEIIKSTLESPAMLTPTPKELSNVEEPMEEESLPTIPETPAMPEPVSKLRSILETSIEKPLASIPSGTMPSVVDDEIEFIDLEPDEIETEIEICANEALIAATALTIGFPASAEEVEVETELPSRSITPETPPSTPQRKSNNGQKKAMPLSVKISRRQSLTPDPPKPQAIYLDYRYKKAYVKLVRLQLPEEEGTLEKMAFSRKRKREVTTKQQVAGKKTRRKTIPVKTRTPTPSPPPPRSRHKSLTPSTSGSEYSHSRSCSTCSSSSESAQGQEEVNDGDEEEPSPPMEAETGSQKTKIKEFNIFENPRPQKKASNYRERYEKRPSLPTPAKSPAHQSSGLLGRGQRSNSTAAVTPDKVNAKNGKQTTSEGKPRSKSMSATTTPAAVTRSERLIVRSKASVLADEKYNRLKAQPPPKPLTEAERRKQRNQRNLENSAKTGCFQIGGEAQLGKFKIPRKGQGQAQNIAVAQVQGQNGEVAAMAFDIDYTQTPAAEEPKSKLKRKCIYPVPDEVYRAKLGLNGHGKRGNSKSAAKSGSEHSSQGDSNSNSNSIPTPSQMNGNGENDFAHEEGYDPTAPDMIQIVPPEFIQTEEVQQGEYGPWESMPRFDSNNLSYYMTPGPMNESTQIVQVQMVEEEFLENLEQQSIECIGEIEVRNAAMAMIMPPVQQRRDSVQISQEILATANATPIGNGSRSRVKKAGGFQLSEDEDSDDGCEEGRPGTKALDKPEFVESCNGDIVSECGDSCSSYSSGTSSGCSTCSGSCQEREETRSRESVRSSSGAEEDGCKTP